MMEIQLSPEFVERFWLNVNKTQGCWLWTGPQTGTGYGRLYNGQRPDRPSGVFALAHRVSYLIANGSLPEGLQLDHLCRNRLCVNPAHLEAVTRKENILRGVSPQAENWRKQFCAHGHALTPDNLVKRRLKEGRVCKRCWNDYQIKWRARRRSLLGNAPFVINERFEGAILHHLEPEIAVWIPRELHETIKHDLLTGKGMPELNEAIARWMG